MEKLKGLLLILIAALLAAGAAGFAFVYVKSRLSASPQKLDTVRIVVASEDITYGTKLTPDQLRLVDFPAASVPMKSYSVMDSVVGQTTKVFLLKGEPVLAPKLSTEGGGLSVRIPENMRASSVNVNEVSGVSGFILPGDRVDVLVTINNIDRPGNSVTKMILQNLEVLAAGIQTTTKNDKPVEVQSVTLLLDPKGSEDLALALYQGKVHLVLRNPADQGIVTVEPTNTDRVIGKSDLAANRSAPRPRPPAIQTVKPKVEEKPVPPPPPPEKKTYTIIRDGKIGEEKFPADKPPDKPADKPSGF